MSLTINSRLCIAPIGRPPVIRVGQYDSNFEIEFEMYTIEPITWDLESGTTAMIRGTKTDKRGYSADCDIDIENKKVTVYGDIQMTAAAGPCVYEIVLKKDDKEISSINFTLQVERAALDADTIPSESKIKEIQDIGQKADEIIEAYENLQFDSTPTAGSTKAVTSGGIKTYVDEATTTDTTLSETGKPADAEAVGNALDGKVDEPSTAGTAGQFLQKGENGNQWVDVETDVDATLTQEGVPADAKAVGDEVTDLKNALDEITNSETVYPNNLLNTQNITTGYYWTDGHHESTSYSNSGYIPVQEGLTYYLWTNANTGVFRPEAMRFVTGYDSSKNFVESSNSSDVSSGYTVPSGVDYIIISAVPTYFSSNGMVTTNGTDATYEQYFEPYSNIEIDMDKVDAYTKAEIDAYKFNDLFSELDLSDALNLYNKETATNGYIAANGSVSPSDTYCYSAKIQVIVGSTYTFWTLYNGSVTSANARFLCAYDKDNSAVISAGSNSAVSTYTVPDGITSISVSFEQNRKALFMVIAGTTQPTKLLPYNVQHYIAKNSFVNDAVQNIIRSTNYLRMDEATATSGQTYNLIDHLDNKKNCGYMFSGKFSSFTSVEIGHGKTETGACYMVVDGTNITTYNSSGNVYSQQAHGLTINDYIEISVKVADTKTARATATICTNGGSVTVTNIIFFGCNGAIYFKCGQSTTDVSFVYTIMDLSKDVFIFGDSYTSLADDKRWPEYAISNNDNNMMICGFAGANSSEEFPSFENVLNLRKPKYLCWFLGMNDGDTSGQISSDWAIYISQVIAGCERNGIIPILATIPNTPIIRNIEKNEWVRNSGCRYVDFARAVGAESAGSTWYTGMLSDDNVHPTAEGAKALWLQLRKDVPEIMERIVS